MNIEVVQTMEATIKVLALVIVWSLLIGLAAVFIESETVLRKSVHVGVTAFIMALLVGSLYYLMTIFYDLFR